MKSRNKLINFRVTEDEYEALRSASVASGARCLSEYARDLMLRGADLECPPTAIRREAWRLDLRVDVSGSRMDRIEGSIRQLIETLNSAPAETEITNQ